MSLYYYHNLPRLCYWWQNPNESAVMIGLLVPFLWILAWYIEKENFPSEINYLIWIVECAALMLLVYTFSRWAILAGICSALSFGYIVKRPQNAEWKNLLKAMKATWLRVSVLVIALIITGAWGRFLIAAQGDRSVLNRFTLWTGGLKMIADKPFFGWGDGTAGVNYDNWYQDLSFQTFHGGMTNSYLNIAVEWGLPVLAVILFFLLLSIFVSFYLAISAQTKHRGLLAGGAAIIVFFTLANVGYSTIYNVSSILLLTVGVFIVAAFCIRKVAQTWRTVADARNLSVPKTLYQSGPDRSVCATFIKPLLLAFIVSIVCVFSLYLGGVYALRNEPIRVSCVSAGNVFVCKSGSSNKAVHFTIGPDYSTLGICYGRSIRKLLVQDADNFDAVQVLEPGTDFNSCIGEKVIVMGARARDWGTRVPAAGQGIIFVCPTIPPAGSIKLRQLFLPRIDRWHVVDAWKSWAEKNGCPLTFLMGDGFQDETNMRKILEYCNKL